MISYDLWPSLLLGNYQLTTNTNYRTKLSHEYTIYNHESSRPWIVKYTTVLYPSVYSYTNVLAIVACTVLMYAYGYTLMISDSYKKRLKRPNLSETKPGNIIYRHKVDQSNASNLVWLIPFSVSRVLRVFQPPSCLRTDLRWENFA
jgi:hypothetical protein